MLLTPAYAGGRPARPYRRLAAGLCRRNAACMCAVAVDRSRQAMTRRNQSLDLLRGRGHPAGRRRCIARKRSTGVVPGLTWCCQGVWASSASSCFFIVSGYTMMLTFGDRVDLARRAARSIFGACLRIAPLFWVAIVFYLLADERPRHHALCAGRRQRQRRAADVPLPAFGQRHRLQFGRSRRLEHRGGNAVLSAVSAADRAVQPAQRRHRCATR